MDIKAGIQLIKGSHSVETFQRGALSITIEEKEMAIDKAELLNQVQRQFLILSYLYV